MEYLVIESILAKPSTFCLETTENVCAGLLFTRNEFMIINDLVCIPKNLYPLFKLHTKYFLSTEDLEFLYNYDKTIINNITHLGLIATPTILEQYLPELTSLKYLDWQIELDTNPNSSYPLNNLPNSLEGLRISGVESLLQTDLYLELNNLPQKLKYLGIEYAQFNSPIDYLPSQLEILTIHSRIFNQSLDNLPINLKVLAIHGHKFNQPINNLPATLEYLALISYWCHQYTLNYTQEITRLPAGLKHCILEPYLYDIVKQSSICSENCKLSNNNLYSNAEWIKSNGK